MWKSRSAKAARPCACKAAGGDGAVAGQQVTLSLRPEDITIDFEKPASADGNLFEGEVVDTIYLGSLLECRVKVGRYEIGIQIDHYEQIAPQQKVYLSFRPDHGLCLTA